MMSWSDQEHVTVTTPRLTSGTIRVSRQPPRRAEASPSLRDHPHHHQRLHQGLHQGLPELHPPVHRRLRGQTLHDKSVEWCPWITLLALFCWSTELV